MKVKVKIRLDVEIEQTGESDDEFDLKFADTEERVMRAREEMELMHVQILQRRLPEVNWKDPI